MTHKPNETRRIASLTDLQSAASGRRRSRSKDRSRIAPRKSLSHRNRSFAADDAQSANDVQINEVRRMAPPTNLRSAASWHRRRRQFTDRTEKIAFSLKSVLCRRRLPHEERKKPSSSAASAAAHAARPIAYGVLSPLARYWRPLANAESLRLIKTRFVTIPPTKTIRRSLIKQCYQIPEFPNRKVP
jgi:hypothetical protein